MLEVCVDHLESVKAAYDGGATRIELCSALGEGGLTPSVGFLHVVKKKYPTLQVFAMLRPHGGNNFIYSQLDMECVLSDLNHLRNAGADGFVFGALKADRSIDEINCQLVISTAGPLPVTFHRAFDITHPSALEANLKVVHALGFKRLLTSGLAPNALAGIDNIRKLIVNSSGMIVMPGAGITTSNVTQILEQSGCIEFHASARLTAHVDDERDHINGIDFGANNHKPSDRETVLRLVNIGNVVIRSRHDK